jgi:serine protease Do
MTNDGEKMQAKVLARDSFLDVAFLKVDPKSDLPVLKMGDSEKLDIGETVIAIGNSLGEFRNTVSKGIVSGLKRNIEAGSSYGQSEVLEEVIQTDAAINPGNSGGPLLNLEGEVVGINVAMAQGAENIGFSIPVNQIKDIYQSVKTKGKIVRPYLGVRYVLLNEQIQEANNLSVDYGALILRGEAMSHLAVVPGSPADKAGLEENDIILEVDGEKITEKRGLAEIIRNKKVGEKVKLKVLKDGEEKNIEVVLEESDL